MKKTTKNPKIIIKNGLVRVLIEKKIYNIKQKQIKRKLITITVTLLQLWYIGMHIIDYSYLHYLQNVYILHIAYESNKMQMSVETKIIMAERLKTIVTTH